MSAREQLETNDNNENHNDSKSTEQVIMTEQTKQKLIHEKIDKIQIDTIKIVGLPKGSVMWPTAVTALILGLLGLIFSNLLSIFSVIFLIVFTTNLLVLFFDFSRGAVIGIIGFIVAAFSLAFALKISVPFNNLFKTGVIHGASADFFAIYGFIFLTLLFLAMFFRRHFEYYQLSSNEMLRKFGVLGDSERFNSPEIHFKKHITDVFESLLLFGAGDLIITTVNGREFHINNVPHINKLEKRITKLLSRLDVDVNTKDQAKIN